MSMNTGNDSFESTAMLDDELKAARVRAMQKQGLSATTIGALMLLVSCLLSFAFDYSHPLFEYALYGLSTLGIGVVFYGLIKIFG